MNMLEYAKEKPMATLYVENVPDDLYQALRDRAHMHRKSIAAEVLTLLEENIITAEELQSRQEFLARVRNMRSQTGNSAGPFSSTEDMQREDRAR
jgi:plasmid stability protein